MTTSTASSSCPVDLERPISSPLQADVRGVKENGYGTVNVRRSRARLPGLDALGERGHAGEVGELESVLEDQPVKGTFAPPNLGDDLGNYRARQPQALLKGQSRPAFDLRALQRDVADGRIEPAAQAGQRRRHIEIEPDRPPGPLAVA